MEISQAQMTSMTCEQCGAIFTAPVWLIVDIDERPDLLGQLLLDTLHDFVCPDCHQIAAQLDAPLLLYRHEANKPVVYSPAETATPDLSSQQRADLFVRLCAQLGEDWQSVFSHRGMSSIPHAQLRSFAESELLKKGISPQMPQEIREDQRQAIEAEDRHASTGDFGELDTAIAAWQRVLNNTAFPHTAQEFQQAAKNHAGTSLLNRYAATHLQEDLAQALALLKDAVVRTLSNSPYLADRLRGFAQGLMAMYESSHDLAALAEAVAALQKAVDLSAPSSEHLPDHLELLLDASRTYYGRTKALADLEQVIAAYRKAVEFTPASSPDLPRYLRTLGANLKEHFERTRKPEDLEEAITCFLQAMDLLATDSPELASYLSGLGCSLRLRYEYLGQPGDLEEALKHCRNAVELVAADAPFRAGCRNELGLCLYALYMRTGRAEDLEEAIAYYRQAIEDAVAMKTEVPYCFTNLGNAVRSRYEFTGRVEDLEEAIKACQHAVDLTLIASPDYPLYASNLSNCLYDRFLRTGRLEDLDQIIEDLQRAIDQTPEDTLNLNMYLSNLGIVLLGRYEQTKQLLDLNRAIDALRIAVQLSAQESPDLPRFLSNLGDSLLRRFEDAGVNDDLDQAVDLQRKAVLSTPSDSPELSRHLSNLASVLSICYDHTKQVEILKEAIDNGRSAVAHAPAGSLIRPACLGNLANNLRLLYDSTGQQVDLQVATRTYKEVCEEGKDLAPGVVLTIARDWGNWALERAAWVEAIDAFNYALQASEQLYQVQLLRTSQETRLREAYGLHAGAAYALARAGRLSDAVEAVEHGRARSLSKALEADSTNLEGIQGADSDAYKQYRQATERLYLLRQAELMGGWQHAGSANPALGSDRAPVEQIRQAMKELEQAVSRIRLIPGYQEFLAPSAFSQIAASIRSAPLVYIMATNVGGLALMLFPQAPAVEATITPLWLPDLREPQVREQLLSMNEALSTYIKMLAAPPSLQHADLQSHLLDTFDQTLQWLWQALMGDLVEALSPATSVTLVAGGLLELFPLHAAWREDLTLAAKRRYALDSITFTSIPNARALAAAQEAARQPADVLLAIDDPLPVRNPLKTIGYEVEVARALFSQQQVLRHEDATYEQVIPALGRCGVLHFNGHGYVNFAEPLESGLVLAHEKMLKLRDLLRMRLSTLRLAVLSACETGVAGVKAPDEVISLPTGLLQAGVAGVVASLWEVEANSAMLLMIRFYELWRKGDLPPAEALRLAQLWLRDTSTGEKLAYFERFLGKDAPVALQTDLAWQLYLAAFSLPPIDWARPFYWAAFSYTGV